MQYYREIALSGFMGLHIAYAAKWTFSTDDTERKPFVVMKSSLLVNSIQSQTILNSLASYIICWGEWWSGVTL